MADDRILIKKDGNIAWILFNRPQVLNAMLIETWALFDDLLEAGRDVGALGAMVSGSGPTCAFLARDNIQALDIAVALTSTGLCRSVKRATGPAPGATVIDARSIA